MGLHITDWFVVNGDYTMWLMFAFGSALFAGLTAILSKMGLRDTDSTVATALRTIVVLVFSWILVFINDIHYGISDISFFALVFLVLSGLATGASWLCYFKALQLGDVNKVTPIDKSSIILTMLLAFIILGEPLTWLKIIAMILIGGGTYLMIQKKKGQVSRSVNTKGWLLYAIGSAIFASLTAIVGKIGINEIDSTLGTAIRTIVVLIMAWGMVFLTKKSKLIKSFNRKSIIVILLSGVATGSSWLCYYRALQMGDASIVVPIDKLSIVITIAFSTIFLKEKLTIKSVIGLGFIVVGTLLLLV